ncbi:MAG: hypothetical protein ACLQDC_18040 [Verrucomicrobiia bacterium]
MAEPQHALFAAFTDLLLKLKANVAELCGPDRTLRSADPAVHQNSRAHNAIVRAAAGRIFGQGQTKGKNTILELWECSDRFRPQTLRGFEPIAIVSLGEQAYQIPIGT